VGVDFGIDLGSSLERVKEEAYLFWGDQVRVEGNAEQYREHQATWIRTRLVISTFASVALLIALISILNLMLSRVLKRTSSMGLSMALGASRKMIFLQFLVEASSLGFFGAFLGLGISMAFISLFEMAVLSVLGIQVVLGVLIGFLMSFFFGVYPAYLGSRINPVDALRTDS
jgi:putative ABC transport system permease protein